MNPDKAKTIQLRWKYGITIDDKIRMYAEQKGLCGLCGEPLPVEISKCCADHNHATLVVRALLHRHCNIALGYIEKNPSLAIQILEYLQRFSS
jgi:hypothetical protein